MKKEFVVWTLLTEPQIALYRQFLNSSVVKQIFNTTESPLAALTVLKKICDHPFLLSEKMVLCEELSELTK